MYHRRTWAVLLLFLSACSSTPEVLPERPAEELYSLGSSALTNHNYAAAIQQFQELERQHPYSQWAMQSQLNLIFAQYKNEEFDEVVSTSERFIRMHPRHANASYAYYMRALAKYNQISSAYNDQSRTREAKAAFQEIISRFPDSDYAWESETMLKLCRDRLAEQEMTIARYYLDREQYIAAAKRFREVVDNTEYNSTLYTEEALFSLVLTSVKLGLSEEARAYASILGHNFPGGRFYEQAYDLMTGHGSITKSELQSLRRGVEEGSLIKRILDGLRPGMPGLQ